LSWLMSGKADTRPIRCQSSIWALHVFMFDAFCPGILSRSTMEECVSEVLCI
jgi:hypothetical protein